METLYSKVNVPVIACGGADSADSVAAIFDPPVADAVACASMFHYDTLSVFALKSELQSKGLEVRL